MSRSIISPIALALSLALPTSAIPQTSPPKDKADKIIEDMLKDSKTWKPAPPADASNGIAPTGISAVRETIRPCWNIAGLKTQAVVPIVVQMGRDARPLRAEPRDKVTYGNDPDYRAAADAAVRAVMNSRCQPWPLPPEKYESWRVITLNFDSHL